MPESRVRIQPSEERAFQYKATLSVPAPGGKASPAERSPEPHYLYAQGDLAVFLEDLGAQRHEIGDLLDRLDRGRSAEIVVPAADRGAGIESLWRRSPGALPPRTA